MSPLLPSPSTPRRPPPPPPPPRAPRLPVPIILPRRELDSRTLDFTEHIPFVPWSRFAREYPFRQGEHITLIGRTGSGKTTLAVGGLLPMRRYVVVMATKAHDPSLYPPLERAGFEFTDNPALSHREHPRVMFRPALQSPSREQLLAQREAFRLALGVIYNERNWTVYMDEIRYLSDNLGLSTELETLWLQGRSLGITMVAGTQNPVGIPREAFDQATHLFIWRQTERQRVDRIAELSGAESDLIRALVPSLPAHEALYVRTSDDVLVRTRYPHSLAS